MPKTALALQLENTRLSASGADPIIDSSTRLGFFKEKLVPGAPVTSDDFDLPANAGYPLKQIDEGITGPFSQLDNTYVTNISGISQQGHVSELPVTLKGWFIIKDVAGKEVLYWGTFNEPVVFISTDQNLQLVVRIRSKFADGDTDAVVING